MSKKTHSRFKNNADNKSMRQKLVLVLAIGLIGCSSGLKYKQDPYIREYEPIGTKTTTVEDGVVRVDYIPRSKSPQIPIVITNKSSSVIKIIWDETSFIHPNGSTERVFHAGVKIVDRDKPMVPSVIPSGGKIHDTLVPVQRVSWNRGWSYLPLCGEIYDYQIETTGVEPLVADDDCIGKEFGLFIAYEINGSKKYIQAKYRFKSKVPRPSPEN